MAATYDPALPTDRDWVRFLIGDRTVSSARLQDGEIDAVLAEEANKYLAAARCAEVAYGGGAHGGVIEKAVDDLRLKFSDDAEGAFWTYIESLRAKGAGLTLRRPKMFRTLGSRCSR